MNSRGLGQAFHGAQHYENFPVASWLIPGAIRPSVVQLYRFARTGDDLADEGTLGIDARMAGLAALRAGLYENPPPQDSAELQEAGISLSKLYLLGEKTGQMVGHHPTGRDWADRLLQAFSYDAAFAPFADWHAVMQYCKNSAAPVGRLMLGLFGLWEEAAPVQTEDPDDGPLLGKGALFAESDAICIGLQLINFAQDLHQDLGRHRPTLPQTDWPDDWSWQTAQGPEAQLRTGILTHGHGRHDTSEEDKIRITRALALRGLHQLARGRDLPKRLGATRIPHARRLALEVALTLEGGTTIGERLMQKPLLGWKASTRLSRLWLAAVFINRLPRMLFKTPL